MDTREIDNAIGAHGLWKTRLKVAIDTGKLDASPSEIKMNNHCAFGKWLYGSSLTAQDKASKHYLTISELHSQFHKIAAQIAELALAGRKAEAETLLSHKGEFATVSAKLTSALMDWKKSQTPALVK
ncbi:MAG: CZB domain-containing protein [Candidatus Zixiibacteriota bacterium]